jgi:putative endonuclease
VLADRDSGARRALGAFGERLAVQHLEAKGYRIVERNYRRREGEIDIIARFGEVLAFVEVRCRRGSTMGTAIESLSRTKQRRLVVLAEAYGQDCPGLPEQRRIDVIAVDLAPDGKLLSLTHIEGAVWDE